MPRVPKVVGVRLNSKQGLTRDVADKLRGKWNAPRKRRPGRARRAKQHAWSTARLLRAFREEDEAG